MDDKRVVIEESTIWRRNVRGQRIDAVCWALFFIWIGAVLLVKAIPEGVGSLGVGLIVLGGAAARFLLRVSVSRFWIIIGSIFIAAGVGELAALDLPMLPIALILCGVLMLLHQRSRRHGGPR